MLIRGDLVSIPQGSYVRRAGSEHDIRLPKEIKSVAIANGSFDSQNNRLFISIRNADQEISYKKAPLFLVYKVLNIN